MLSPTILWHEIDPRILEKVVREHLPVLRAAVEKMLKD
jgi:uncharacterized protein with HEPN domain